ncbi:class F sortase [Streptomyces polyrhachis]|uniref:Class F sortase n=1 Tax=Streptomyces polyrhachis TaxID=1282885 RepID=A0ABW2GDN5_9ACTN
MTHPTPSKARARISTALIVLGFAAGIAMICFGLYGFGPPAPDAEDALMDGAPPGRAPLSASAPETVRIPGIEVAAPLARVGLDPEGWVQAPPAEDPDTAGWYAGSVTPGARGTSVLVGHVDSESGPAVFYRAGELKKGRRIEVARADGSTAVFTVYRVQLFQTRDFPSEGVYRDTRHAELRLLTCGGTYRPGRGYSGNTVVFARLTSVR